MNFGEFIMIPDKASGQEDFTRQRKNIFADPEEIIERLMREGQALEEERNLAVSLGKKQERLGDHIDKLNELAVQFNHQVLKRGELTSILLANIKICTPLKGEELARQFPIALASYDNVMREVEKENAILAQSKKTFDVFEEVIEQMKAELSEVAVTNKPLSHRHIASYNKAYGWLEDLKLKFKPSLDYRAQHNETGKNCGEILDNLKERLEQEKASTKDSSPEKTPPLSPKDPSIAKTSSESSSDEQHSPLSSTNARLQLAMNQPAAARNASKMPAVALPPPAAPQKQKSVGGAAPIPQGALAAGSIYKEKEAAGKKQGKQDADKAVKKEKCALM
jgi:hypothetical protein